MEGYEGDRLLRNEQIASNRSRAFYDALVCSTSNRRHGRCLFCLRGTEGKFIYQILVPRIILFITDMLSKFRHQCLKYVALLDLPIDKSLETAIAKEISLGNTLSEYVIHRHSQSLYASNHTENDIHSELTYTKELLVIERNVNLACIPSLK